MFYLQINLPVPLCVSWWCNKRLMLTYLIRLSWRGGPYVRDETSHSIWKSFEVRLESVLGVSALVHPAVIDDHVLEASRTEAGKGQDVCCRFHEAFAA